MDQSQESESMITLTKTIEFDGVNVGMEPIEFSIQMDERPPENLFNVVNNALIDTIGFLVDGDRFEWWQDDGMWYFSFCHGMPEMPGDELGSWLPPYRTAEKFEGLGEGEDGLYGNLPDGWSYDKERKGTYVFYKE